MQVTTGSYREPATIAGAEGIVWHENFTSAEFWDLAHALESLNEPGNQGAPLRRLTDMCWALCNDSSACIVTVEEG